jgi:hypothetical protein
LFYKGFEIGSAQSFESTGVPMLHHVPDSEEIKRQDLRVLRKSLWKRFEDNPSQIHLAAKLKIIDDQLAQRNKQVDYHDACKFDDSEGVAVPEVGGLFVLLAVSERREN